MKTKKEKVEYLIKKWPNEKRGRKYLEKMTHKELDGRIEMNKMFDRHITAKK